MFTGWQSEARMEVSAPLRRAVNMTMSHPHWKAVLATVFCAAACSQPSLAQVPPPTILEVDVENFLAYFEDSSDVSKFATNPNPTTAVVQRNFYFYVFIGDIVAVNGQPAKGTMTRNAA